MTGPDTPRRNFPIGEDELQAFVDERLDGDGHAAVEALLAAHPDLAERIGAERRQRAILRARLEAKFAEPVPARLRIANLRTARRTFWARSWASAAAAIVLFVAGATAGWFANGIAPPPPALAPTASVAQGAQAAYRTFVVEVAHPVEVGVQQEEHLLQWLSKRLGRKLAARTCRTRWRGWAVCSWQTTGPPSERPSFACVTSTSSPRKHGHDA